MIKSKVGLVLGGAYLLLFFVSEGFALWLLAFHKANSEFCGLWAIVVTTPWSLMIIPFMQKLGYIAWYEQYTASTIAYWFFAMLPLKLCALVNAAIAYFLGIFIGASFTTRK